MLTWFLTWFRRFGGTAASGALTPSIWVTPDQRDTLCVLPVRDNSHTLDRRDNYCQLAYRSE